MTKVLAFLCVLLISAPAFAADSCYSPAEAEAEQGIRIHSELMVIALNCQHMTPKGWKNFYLQYQEITARNSALISGYETTLINYYKREGKPNPELSFHDLRTNFANKVSTDAAQMRPDIFCATYAPRLPKVDQMSTAEFKQWASDIRPDHPVSKPVCR